MRLSVTALDAYTGNVMRALNGKRGRIMGMTPQHQDKRKRQKSPDAIRGLFLHSFRVGYAHG